MAETLAGINAGTYAATAFGGRGSSDQNLYRGTYTGPISGHDPWVPDQPPRYNPLTGQWEAHTQDMPTYGINPVEGTGMFTGTQWFGMPQGFGPWGTGAYDAVPTPGPFGLDPRTEQSEIMDVWNRLELKDQLLARAEYQSGLVNAMKQQQLMGIYGRQTDAAQGTFASREEQQAAEQAQRGLGFSQRMLSMQGQVPGMWDTAIGNYGQQARQQRRGLGEQYAAAMGDYTRRSQDASGGLQDAYGNLQQGVLGGYGALGQDVQRAYGGVGGDIRTGYGGPGGAGARSQVAYGDVGQQMLGGYGDVATGMGSSYGGLGETIGQRYGNVSGDIGDIYGGVGGGIQGGYGNVESLMGAGYGQLAGGLGKGYQDMAASIDLEMDPEKSAGLSRIREKFEDERGRLTQQARASGLVSSRDMNLQSRLARDQQIAEQDYFDKLARRKEAIQMQGLGVQQQVGMGGLGARGQALMGGAAGLGQALMGGAAGQRQALMAGEAGYGQAAFGGLGAQQQALMAGQAGYGQAGMGGAAAYNRALMAGEAGFGQAAMGGAGAYGGALMAGQAGYGQVGGQALGQRGRDIGAMMSGRLGLQTAGLGALGGMRQAELAQRGGWVSPQVTQQYGLMTDWGKSMGDLGQEYAGYGKDRFGKYLDTMYGSTGLGDRYARSVERMSGMTPPDQAWFSRAAAQQVGAPQTVKL